MLSIVSFLFVTGTRLDENNSGKALYFRCCRINIKIWGKMLTYLFITYVNILCCAMHAAINVYYLSIYFKFLLEKPSLTWMRSSLCLGETERPAMSSPGARSDSNCSPMAASNSSFHTFACQGNSKYIRVCHEGNNKHHINTEFIMQTR